MMIKTTLILFVSVFALSLSMASPDHEACKADREKFCKGLTMGHGLLRCMKKNEAQLSTECKEWVTNRKEHAREAHEACKADVEKFCKDTKPGAGRVIKCLKEHEAELSSECKAMEHHKRAH